MRDYGKVSPQFWIGGTGKLLRGNPDAQVLALYLMTSPHATMTGVFHCPIVYMAHETGLSIEVASKGLARLIEVGFCEYDDSSESVFVVNMAAYQIDDSLKAEDKRVLGLQKEVAKMLPALFKQRFTEVYGDRFHLVKQGKKQSPTEAPSKPLPSQEQEQEQEQEQKQEQEQENTAPAKADGFDFKTALLDAGGSADHVADWMAVRKKLKATNTKTAFAVFMREVGKSGMTVDEVLEVCCARSWKGFDFDWMKPSAGKNVTPFLTAQQQRDENNRRSTEEFLNDTAPIFGNVIDGECANA